MRTIELGYFMPPCDFLGKLLCIFWWCGRHYYPQFASNKTVKGTYWMKLKAWCHDFPLSVFYVLFLWYLKRNADFSFLPVQWKLPRFSLKVYSLFWNPFDPPITHWCVCVWCYLWLTRLDSKFFVWSYKPSLYLVRTDVLHWSSLVNWECRRTLPPYLLTGKCKDSKGLAQVWVYMPYWIRTVV